MKESTFIKQNIKKWNDFEGELPHSKRDPKKISKLFVQITDDLAYSQTFYKNRSVRVYLNGVAQLLFNDISKTSRIKFSALLEFWKVQLPLTVYKARYELLLSLILFLVALGIGIISSVHQPEFARTVLGDDYIDMTVANIEKGPEHAMDVYKGGGQGDMFLAITANNIMVALRTFVSGLFFMIGTVFIMLYNGIMVGTFQYFFVEHGLFKESFLTIWQHGTIEISSIIISGGAGLTLGKGLLFPGTYTRFQSLRLSARRGAKIMIGLFPLFIFAGFIESFFTRYTNIDDFYRALTIFMSAAFVIVYFVIYPFRVAKKHPERLDIGDKINPTDNSMPDFTRIQNDEMLFGNALKIIKKHFGQIVLFISILASVMGLTMALFASDLIETVEDEIGSMSSLADFVSYQDNQIMFLINTVILALIIGFGAHIVNSVVQGIKPKISSFFRTLPKWIVSGLVFTICVNVLFFMNFGWAILLLIIILPFTLFGLFLSFSESRFVVSSIDHTFKLLKKTFNKFFLQFIKFFFLSIPVYFLMNPGFYTSAIWLLLWNMHIEDTYQNSIFDFLFTFIFYFGMMLTMVALSIAMGVLYYTLNEISQAKHLLARIEKIGQKKRLKGYEID